MEPTIQIVDEYLDIIYLEEGFKEFVGSLKEKTITKMLDSAKKSKDINSLKSIFKNVPSMSSDKLTKIAKKQIPELKVDLNKTRTDDKDPNVSEFKKLINMTISIGEYVKSKLKDATSKSTIDKYLKKLKSILEKGSKTSFEYSSVVFQVSFSVWLYAIMFSFILPPVGVFLNTAASAQFTVGMALFIGGIILSLISSLVNTAVKMNESRK